MAQLRIPLPGLPVVGHNPAGLSPRVGSARGA